MRILSIETSCDETAVAILEFQKSRKKNGDFILPKFKILSNIISSQVKLHTPFGGVVPNLAKREHQRNLVPILIKTLKETRLLKLKVKSQKSKSQLKTEKLNKILEREQELLKQLLDFLNNYDAPKIDLISVTNGPGLEPALWVGINFAKALSFAWNLPIIGINHLEGHIFSVFFRKNGKEKSKFQSRVLGTNSKQIQNSKLRKIEFPALALIVSGGHTELVLIHPHTKKGLTSLTQFNKSFVGVRVKKWLDYKIIGETRDDAAGEAFDKTARILGLEYPGGPAIATKAAEFLISNFQFPNKFKIQNSKLKINLPRPMLNTKDFDFSFSGLKTAVLYLVQDLKKQQKNISNLIPAIAYEFQEAVIDVLIKKTLRAAEKFNAKTIILCGGVSANKELRYRLSDSLYKKYGENFNFLMPEIEFSGDNAAMIALAAYFRTQKNPPKSNDLWRIEADGNLNF